MKQIVCGCFGTIYYATITKGGMMNPVGRRECTDECVDAVTEHITSKKEYLDCGVAGYSWEKKDKDGDIRLIVYDTSKYKLVKVEE